MGLMAEIVDYFFSFRSPYSYLSGPRAFALPDSYDIDLRFHGVIPMAMREQAVPQAKRIHTVRDVAREAKRLGMPFGPIWDPIGEGATRVLAVSEHAKDAGREKDFVLNASRGIWAEAKDVSQDGPLREICQASGLDWADCARAISDPAYAERVEANVQALAAVPHWGVPVFVFRGEAFWGQDRIAYLEDALRIAGLARSAVV
jgi:2-hydroxychromene-2-carboxylate isomerase